MNRRIRSVSAILLLVGLLAVAAYAAVTFDPSSGTGFVGKGDVQTAFGWNNAELQANASGVTFTYVAVDTYDVTVEWDTGNADQPQSIQHHIITQTKRASVNATVAYDARTHKQIDGFILTGYGSTTTEGTIPSVGDILVDPQTGNPYPTDHVVTAVTLVSSTGGLYVNYGSTSVLIWP